MCAATGAGAPPEPGGVVPRDVPAPRTLAVLSDLRRRVRSGRFTPERVRRRRIPKAGGKVRSLGIPTMADRIVQASLKLVLEPIFEADFHPSSYGFRPRRRAQDAIAEIHELTSRPADYEWVFEADIEACFDEIDHTALMGRVRERVGDKRILALIRGLSEAGVLSEDGAGREDPDRHPARGGISCLRCWPISPYPSRSRRPRCEWDALGPDWERAKHRRRGGAVMKMIRLRGRLRHPRPRDAAASARALRAEVGRVLAPMGLRLSADKTRLTHIEEGFEFLGWRIQRRKKKGTRGTTRVYTYPSKKSLASIIDRIRILTRRTAHRTLADLLRRLNPAIRGWCAYFQHGVSKRTFCYVDNFAFRRILGWLYKRHPRLNKHTVNRRFLPGWRIRDDGIEFFRACRVPVTRYRYRGTRIPSPRGGERHGITRVESRMRRNAHVRFGGRPAETHPRKRGQGAAGRPYTYIRTWVGFVYLATVLDCCYPRKSSATPWPRA